MKGGPSPTSDERAVYPSWNSCPHPSAGESLGFGPEETAEKNPSFLVLGGQSLETAGPFLGPSAGPILGHSSELDWVDEAPGALVLPTQHLHPIRGLDRRPRPQSSLQSSTSASCSCLLERSSFPRLQPPFPK